MTKVDKVKEKIIETSLYLFNTNGITRTSIQDIMTATELPKGSIYRRFKSKEEIVLAPTTKVVRLCGVIFIKQWKIKRQQLIKSLQFSLYIKMQLIILLLLEAVHYLIVPLKVLEYFQNYKSVTKGYDDTVMLMASLIKRRNRETRI